MKSPMILYFLASIWVGAVWAQSPLTGEQLTVLYVQDVRKSVAYYRALGFGFDHYYDYRGRTYTREWTRAYPPDWGQVSEDLVRIGLTTVASDDQVYGGGARHYFIINDLE